MYRAKDLLKTKPSPTKCTGSDTEEEILLVDLSELGNIYRTGRTKCTLHSFLSAITFEGDLGPARTRNWVWSRGRVIVNSNVSSRSIMSIDWARVD